MALKRNPVRLAVIGAGRMGLNHLRVYNMLKGVDVVAVVDPDVERAHLAAQRYGCKAFRSPEDLGSDIQAASVAVPSNRHAEVASVLLNSGIHCLIEKPLATNEDECQELIELARERQLVLLVGHVERFNPVVQQLYSLVSNKPIYALDARRMSQVSSRITDVDVVADLMVHDLDIVLALMKSPVTSIAAHGVAASGVGGHDYVTALLTFANGGIASLTASRITQNKIRELHVTTDLGLVTANYLTQELLIYRQGAIATLEDHEPGPEYVLDLAIERVFVANREPLVLELQHFLDAVAKGIPLVVTAEDGLEALRLVWEIQRIASGLGPSFDRG